MATHNISLSIIVPVYNVEHYLEKCILSLIDQDLNKSDYEIIAVNDGSTDNSLAKLQGLKEVYNDNVNLKIISQENQGLSGARNSGLKVANGDYIIFVDSDDILLPSTIKSLVETSQKNQLDILEFGASGITETGQITFTQTASSNGKVLNGKSYIENISYMGSACNKVYSLNFLNTHKLRFMPRVYIEDIEFNTRAVYKCERIMATDMVGAHFLQREGSITRTKNFNKSKKMIYDIFTVLSSINNFALTEVPENSKAYIVLKRRVSSLVATMLKRVLKETTDFNICEDILNKLEDSNLYPTKHKPLDSSKALFMSYANNKALFRLSCKLFCKLNTRK
ncbi:glycosyltransferase [Flavobacteriaceae bacterium SZ-1-7]|uniref:glycosyltransferase n=1 Tax=Tamlana sedimenti TaxID=3134126 RepID=UPI003124CC5E